MNMGEALYGKAPIVQITYASHQSQGLGTPPGVISPPIGSAPKLDVVKAIGGQSSSSLSDKGKLFVLRGPFDNANGKSGVLPDPQKGAGGCLVGNANSLLRKQEAYVIVDYNVPRPSCAMTGDYLLAIQRKQDGSWSYYRMIPLVTDVLPYVVVGAVAGGLLAYALGGGLPWVAVGVLAGAAAGFALAVMLAHDSAQIPQV